MQTQSNNNLEAQMIGLTALISQKDLEISRLREAIRSLTACLELKGETVPALKTIPETSNEIKVMADSHIVVRNNEMVSLTAREFKLFQQMYSRPNALCTREDLIKEFDNELDMTLRNVDVHIFSLRKKLKKVNIQIETVWGQGYKLVA